MHEPSTTERSRQRWAAMAIAALCALVALSLYDRRADERTLRAANEAGAAGDYREALRLARTLTEGTTAADARYVEAQVRLRQSRFAEARTALEAAIRERPSDWRARRDLAGVLLFLGDRSAARREYARALAQNPRQEPLPVFTEPRDR